MDLFSLGVFDDERTPRERAAKPVRCLEEELLPRVVYVRPLCVKCKISEARPSKQTCNVCVRNSRASERQKAERRRYTRRKTHERMVRDGYHVVTYRYRGIAADLVKDKKARWATPRDLNRLGFSPDASVILPAERAE